MKVNGLPAGLKADPVTLTPEQSDFTIPVIADVRRRPGSGDGQRRDRVSGQQERLSDPGRPASP